MTTPNELSREQAFAFISSLWPNGQMSYLDNPTRTYFSALLGYVPNGEPYSATDPNMDYLREMARILRQIAKHIEISGEEANRGRV